MISHLKIDVGYLCSKCLARMHSGGFPSHPGRAEGGRAFRRNDYRFPKSILQTGFQETSPESCIFKIDSEILHSFLRNALPPCARPGWLGEATGQAIGQ